MRERIKTWIIKKLGGYVTPPPFMLKCGTPNCCMFIGHGGPHRHSNGLAFSTMKAKERAQRKMAATAGTV